MADADRTAPYLTAVVVSTRGLVRERNEDGAGAFNWTAPAEQRAPVLISARTPGPAAVVVADGLGGHAAGNLASALVVQGFLGAAAGLRDTARVSGLCVDLDARVRTEAARDPSREGMGSTLAALVFTGAQVLLAHVGDSRIYYADPGLLRRLTEDDIASDGGLTQCLGGYRGAPRPHVRSMPLDPGARFLLCSDGLHGYVPEEEMRRALGTADLVAAADALTDAAYAAGAPDNVSLALVTVDDRPPVSWPDR